MLKSIIGHIISTVADTVAGKVVAVAVAGGITAAGASVAVHNSQIAASSQAATSSATALAAVQEASSIESTTLSSSENSSAPVSSETSSATSTTGNAEIDSAVSAGVQKINSAADAAVSRVQGVATSSSSEVVTPPSEKPEIPKHPETKYPVIDPSTGKWVGDGEANYETFKSELGGDAGTVPVQDSKAIQAALKALAEKQATASSSPPSSTESK